MKHPKFLRLLLASAWSLAAGNAFAADAATAPAAEAKTFSFTRDERLDAAFEAHAITGVMVVYDAQANTWLTNDLKRAHTGYLPASTFKIPNSLISLEVGAVADVDEVLPWDGIDRGSTGWNASQSMRDAYSRSTVWFYQECARRVGEVRMRHWLNRCHYGNRNLAGGIDQFWLSGALRITPVQQIAFLRRLQDGTLPFRPAVMTAVRGIMVRDKGEGWVLRAKTGWIRESLPQIGWYVGWLERDGRLWFFATELDLGSDADGPKRLALTYANLVRIGALPEGTKPLERR